MTELFELLRGFIPELLKQSKQSAKRHKELMKELDALNSNLSEQTTAIVDLTAAVNNAVTAIGSGAVNPAEIQVAADSVAKNTGDVVNLTNALKGALNPPQP